MFRRLWAAGSGKWLAPGRDGSAQSGSGGGHGDVAGNQGEPWSCEEASVWNDMNPEIMVQVLSYLGREDMGNARLVCVAWLRLSKHSVRFLSPRGFESWPFEPKGNFEGVRELVLSRLRGVLDERLACLRNLPLLTSLRVKRCPHLTDVGMATIASLGQLEELNIAKCPNVTDEGVTALASGLPHLTALNLKCCYKVTDEAMQALSALTGLRILNVSHCVVVGDGGMRALTVHTALRVLKVSDCERVTDTGVEAIATLEGLEALHCNTSPRLRQWRTDASLRTIGSQLTRLTTLKIALGPEVTEEGVAHLSHLTALKELRLARGVLPMESVLGTVAKMELLEALRIDDCGPMAEDCFELLASLAHLKCLFLRTAPQEANDLSDSGLALLASLPRLEELTVSGFAGVCGRTLPLLRGLRKLDMTHCKDVLDVSLSQFSSLTDLRHLNLSGNKGISDSGIAWLSGIGALEQLTLCDCANVTGVGFGMLSSLPGLKTLTLAFCPNISDDGLAQIGRVGALVALNLAKCASITDNGLVGLGRGELRNLRTLNIMGCTRLTDAGVTHLQRKLPGLKKLERKSWDPTLIDVLSTLS